MKGLQFIQQKKPQQLAPERVDTACFVGFVNRRAGEIPQGILQWLANRGWLHSAWADSELATASRGNYRESALDLRDVPVPIESWDEFDRLFEWEARAITSSLRCATWLGVAVKAFFAQGGRRCYVINAGEPFAYNMPREQRVLRVQELLPGYAGSASANANDRSSWRGIGHLFGLPEVSFLSVPDLVDIFRSDGTFLSADVPPAPQPEEHFVECSQELPAAVLDSSLAGIEPPRYSEQDYQDWCTLAADISDYIRSNFRELQFVCSLPLPQKNEMLSRRSVLPFLYRSRGLDQPVWFSKSQSAPGRLESAFLQINYPWLKTAYDNRLPQGLEPGEGSLIGLLARNALIRGTFRSAVPVSAQLIVDVYPKLSLSHMSGLQRDLNAAGASDSLEDRISLWQINANGKINLRSDVTTSANVLYRNASVGRAMAMILRYARHLGEDFIFERNGEKLWKHIRSRLSGYLNVLFQMGVLDGRNPAEAYTVRCDRSTMSQQELDSGVVKAEVIVNITASLETMIIAFSVQGNNEPGILAGAGGAA
ncbi:Phage tail sheath protein FI [Alteromonadaceae bacterium Bs31]|nr:Phage tail sheath protein FI [Alteromonadaceae bacterium Bs31]